jgi:hypothetical protein
MQGSVSRRWRWTRRGGAVAASLLLVAGQARAAGLDPAQVPASAAEPVGFVPAGWKLEALTRADLDGDGREDAVLELIERPGGAEQRPRALVVALAVATGGFSRAGVGPDVLLCLGCAGMLDTGEERASVVEVENNVIVLDEIAGSRITDEYRLRLRYDPEARRVRVIGRDETTSDRVLGGSATVSENYLTGKRVVTVENAAKIDREAMGPIPKPGTSRGAPRTILLEDAHLVEPEPAR